MAAGFDRLQIMNLKSDGCLIESVGTENCGYMYRRMKREGRRLYVHLAAQSFIPLRI